MEHGQYGSCSISPFISTHSSRSGTSLALLGLQPSAALGIQEGFPPQKARQYPASSQFAREIPKQTSPQAPVSKHQGALFSKDSQRGSSVWKIQLCSIAPWVSPPSQLSQGQKELPKNQRSSLFNSGTYARSHTLWQSQFPFTIRVYKLDATGLK